MPDCISKENFEEFLVLVPHEQNFLTWKHTVVLVEKSFFYPKIEDAEYSIDFEFYHCSFNYDCGE